MRILLQKCGICSLKQAKCIITLSQRPTRNRTSVKEQDNSLDENSNNTKKDIMVGKHPIQEYSIFSYESIFYYKNCLKQVQT